MDRPIARKRYVDLRVYRQPRSGARLDSTSAGEATLELNSSQIRKLKASNLRDVSHAENWPAVTCTLRCSFPPVNLPAVFHQSHVMSFLGSQARKQIGALSISSIASSCYAALTCDLSTHVWTDLCDRNKKSGFLRTYNPGIHQQKKRSCQNGRTSIHSSPTTSNIEVKCQNISSSNRLIGDLS
jgi:hypothetical protein